MKWFFIRSERDCGKNDYNQFGVKLSTVWDPDPEDDYNLFSIHFFKRYWYWKVPPFLKPKSIWRDLSNASWATPGPDGKKGYRSHLRKSYGFSVDKTTFHWNWGVQTDEWPTSTSGCWFLPWNEVDQIRHEVFELAVDGGKHYPLELLRIDAKWNSPYRKKNKKDPSAFQKINEARYEIKDRKQAFEYGKHLPYFAFLDYTDPYDGSKIRARCFVEEREWCYGGSSKIWKALMSWRKHIVRRSIDIEFEDETGPGKGSWKGGTLGCSNDLLPGESVEECLDRYAKERGMTS